jgi:protein HIRA/HIR1
VIVKVLFLSPQGPTDKQIEARTSDGRRRITPIFIPPPSVDNGLDEAGGLSASTFGMGEFASSSTQEKSRIAIEKRDDIVRPNVSPGKVSNENSNTAPSSDQKPQPQPEATLIMVKKKPKEPAVEVS